MMDSCVFRMVSKNSFRLTDMNIPCKSDCADRRVGCHGKCEKYIAWKQQYDEEKAGIDKKKHLIGEQKEMARQSAKNMKRGKRK